MDNGRFNKLPICTDAGTSTISGAVEAIMASSPLDTADAIGGEEEVAPMDPASDGAAGLPSAGDVSARAKA